MIVFLKSWLSDRIKIVMRETVRLYPLEFDCYHKMQNDQLVIKLFGDTDRFKRMNYHVVYPKKLNRNFQKKILRLIYLYGIPKENGIEKIENMLGYKSSNYKSILVFVFKILLKCMKYQPNLIQLLKTLPKIDYNMLNDQEYCDMEWIKKEAIISVSEHVYLIYQVRENLNWYISQENSKLINVPEWKEITEKYKWWNLDCDIILFKFTAYYGFMFNSLFAVQVKDPNLKSEDIALLREEEYLFLTPITNNPKLNYLGPFLDIELKKKRINEILNCIKIYHEKETLK